MWFSWLSILAMLVLTCAGVALPQAKAPVQPHKRSAGAQTVAQAKPNVLVITLDTTRADRLGFLGSKLGLTPNLDELAKQGVVLTRAYSHVPLTPPSHATILTGTYPQFNHVNDFGVRLSADIPYLPEILHRRGYQTAAFVSSVILDPVEGAGLGFDRG